MDNQHLILREIQALKSSLANTKTVLSSDEAAAFLNLELAYLYKLTSAGIIPFSKPNGKKIYFSRTDLEAWALSNRSSSQQEKATLAATHIATKR
jgi:excisionase family DNA binding protein